MPFDKMDFFSDKATYEKKLKEEYRKLKEGILSEFWYFGGISMDGKDKPVVVFGKKTPQVTKTLKDQSQEFGKGMCFLEDGQLKISKGTGKMPDAALIKAFKASKIKYTIVKGDAAPVSGAEDAKVEADAKKRWKATVTRWQKVQDKLSATDLADLKAAGKLIADAMKQKKWSDAIENTKKFDADLVAKVKAGLVAEKQAAEDEGKQVDTKIDSDDTKRLVAKIKSSADKVDRLSNAMGGEMSMLQELREDLKAEKDKAALEDINNKITARKSNVDKARKLLDQERKSYESMAGALKRSKDQQAGVLMDSLKAHEEKISGMEDMLDDMPFEQVQNELKDTVKKMTEATAWREEQLKKEETSRAHGTGRHGAQTGLERQARRAATTEIEQQTTKTGAPKPGKYQAKKGTGITPDQADNVSGTSKSSELADGTVVEWNMVKITYTEEDGKRVIKDRQKVAKAIAAVPSRTGGSDTGSMWATPVLEKESYDRALGYASKLSKYTQFGTTKGPVDFVKITLKMPKPLSSPGWGYAVQKNDRAAVDPVLAEKILKLFEAGTITLDRLFKEMNVRLLTEDGGAKMVEHATVVLERATSTSDWKLLTQYPNDNLTAADVSWIPNGNPTATKFYDARGAETVLNPKSGMP